MGKAQRFERRLQGMVGDAFARVFGGSVVPQEVAQALQREADDNARPLAGGRVLAPNRYTVTLGVADHDRLTGGDERRVIRMLKECIQAHLAEQGWDVYGDVVVIFKQSATLHTGQFRTSSSVDPDTPHPRSAGDRSMSQQPDEDRNYGIPGIPPSAPDYRQGAGYGYYAASNPAAAPDVQDYGVVHDYGYAQGSRYQPDSGYSGYGYGSDSAAELGYDQDSYRQRSASLVLDDGSNRHLQLTEGTTVVGRGPEAQFRLPDTGVSRRHLEITWDGHSALLADLGSTNGTTVNGTPVQTWQLVDGDVVRIGQSRLVFRTRG